VKTPNKGDGNTSERLKNCSKTTKINVFPVGDTEINKMADFQKTSTCFKLFHPERLYLNIIIV
jgi:hypothetical protein